jgi:hypothetical protein
MSEAQPISHFVDPPPPHKTESSGKQHGGNFQLKYVNHLLGYVLGDFFTNSSGHPGQLPSQMTAVRIFENSIKKFRPMHFFLVHKEVYLHKQVFFVSL